MGNKFINITDGDKNLKCWLESLKSAKLSQPIKIWKMFSKILSHWIREYVYKTLGTSVI